MPLQRVLVASIAIIWILVLGLLFADIPEIYSAFAVSLVAAATAIAGVVLIRRREQALKLRYRRWLNSIQNSEAIPEQMAEHLEQLSHCNQSIAQQSNKIAIASAQVSHASGQLAKQINEEVEDANRIANSTDQIRSSVENIAQLIQQAVEKADAVQSRNEQGSDSVQSTLKQMQQTREQAASNTQLITDLANKSTEISQVTGVISDIAEQTNLLALNAAIEAARAGEQGRGFAVVADEVRNLAHKTTNATEQIAQTIGEIQQAVQSAVDNIQTLTKAVDESVERTEETGEQLQQIAIHSEQLREEILAISEHSQGNVGSIDAIASVTDASSRRLQETADQIDGVAKSALSLSDFSETIYGSFEGIDTGTVHDEMLRGGRRAVEEIQRCFETAIAQGEISEADLFDRDYQEIPDTNPPKFHTRFDHFTDRVLPSIQEPLLTELSDAVYAGAVDNNGYFPTHNKVFSKPLSGNYDTDLVNNRTKRIFDDRTGSRCGSNTEPCLLQTYMRDTGEVMHDLSIPIYIKGRHWGGFRIGYGSS